MHEQDAAKHRILVEAKLDKIASEWIEGNCLPLLQFFVNYTSWNGHFANGVIALASNIGRARSLFVDRDVLLPILADRSNYIASYIFDAARDEYDDRDSICRAPHRSLAQAFMEGLIVSQNGDPKGVHLLESARLFALNQKVYEGYIPSPDYHHCDLFRGMGYHIGSELLADAEFTLIDRMFKTRLPEIYKSLKDGCVVVAGSQLNCYDWIRIHSGDGNAVEQDHSEKAYTAFNEALRYTDKKDHDEYKQQVEIGIQQFAADHEAFFAA